MRDVVVGSLFFIGAELAFPQARELGCRLGGDRRRDQIQQSSAAGRRNSGESHPL